MIGNCTDRLSKDDFDQNLSAALFLLRSLLCLVVTFQLTLSMMVLIRSCLILGVNSIVFAFLFTTLLSPSISTSVEQSLLRRLKFFRDAAIKKSTRGEHLVTIGPPGGEVGVTGDTPSTSNHSASVSHLANFIAHLNIDHSELWNIIVRLHGELFSDAHNIVS